MIRHFIFWWTYAGSRPDALDLIWMGPDNHLWRLEGAPWSCVWALLFMAMFVVAVTA